MIYREFEGINSFLIETSDLLLKEGVKRQTRGFNCYELPYPFFFKINKPTARICTIPQRKWNAVLPFAESLWIALGRNDLNFIGHYLKKMKDFSDDGLFLRGAYGPRIRFRNGTSDDYKIDFKLTMNKKHTYLDQFEFVEKTFKKDINTRQAVIDIGDPLKDCFDETKNLKETKDFPCSRILHFVKQPNSNKLNLTVFMRSNDIYWGASAVNIFNFTFMLEYFSKILGLEIGEYYQLSNNFHFYENFKDKLIEISKIKEFDDYEYVYAKSFNTLQDFDNLLKIFQKKEINLRTDHPEQFDFQDDFFNDWYKVLYWFNTKEKLKFLHPSLNKIFNGGK